MTSQSPDLILDRVRAADPVMPVPLPSEGETDAALRRIQAMAATRRRHRRLILRTITLAAGVAGVALLIVDASSPGPRRPGVAEARAFFRGASAGLAVPAGAVLHTDYTAVQTFPNGRSTQWREDSWEETSRPYDERDIHSPAGQPSREITITDGRLQLYDPRRKTICTGESPPPYTVRRATLAGRYLLTAGTQHASTITASQLHGLRDGQDTIVMDPNGPSVVPYSSIVNRPFDIRETALALLRSGHAQVQDHLQFARQAAIEISGPGQVPVAQSSYYLQPRTHQPLGMVQRFAGDTTVTLRIATYQLLPATVANRKLVTLPGAHPSALIDTGRPTTTLPPTGSLRREA